MKLFLFSAVLASFATNAFGQIQANDAADLKQLWDMTNAQIEYNDATNVYTLQYDVDDRFGTFTSGKNLNEEFYINDDCKTEESEDNVLTSGIENSALSTTGDAGSKKLVLTFQVIPDKITKTDSYNAADGSLSFCVRNSVGYGGDDTNTNLSLNAQIGAGFKEVNFIETLINIQYTLDGTFSVLAIGVAPKEKASDTRTEAAYGLTAYLCDTAETETQDFAGGAEVIVPKVKTQGDNFNQGALITICVRPNNDAYLEGVVMDYIDNFKWERKVGTPIEVEQEAIVGGAAASNLLTYYSCASGSAYCSFSSILFADFYITDGQATGSGGARTKFEGTRRLNENDEGRALQEAEGDSPFDIAVAVQATDEGPGALKTAGGVSLGFTALASVMALAGSVLFF